MNAERLVDDKRLREKYVGRVEVLDKVKALSLLPNSEVMTLRQVAEYYEVDILVIRKIHQRHLEEFTSDGVKTLKGQVFKDFKQTIGHNVLELKQFPSTTIIPRRGILRFGMLLRDSEVAKQIRTYLLNVEENTPKETKQNSFDNSRTEQENLIILNCVLDSIHNKGTLQQGLEKASRLINKKFSTTSSRWHNKIKKIVSSDTLNAIKNNHRKSKVKNNNIIEFKNNQDIDYVEVLNNKFDDVIRENIKLVKQNKELEMKVCGLEQTIKTIKVLLDKQVK